MSAGEGRRGAVRWAAVLLAAILVVAQGVGSVAAAEVPVLSYDFELESGTDGSTTFLLNNGSAPVQASVATAYDGSLESVASHETQGSAVKFPAFDAAGTGGRAVIKVVNTTGTDGLAPADQDFSWSADFRLDADSESHSEGSHDNGNNLLQRGLYNDTQFKLDVDDGRPSCRLRGSTGNAGAVRITAPVTVGAHAWYNATCTRAGDMLTVSVSAFDSAGTVTDRWSNTATSPAGFGTVTWANLDTPLSIGGKLRATGNLGRHSDQFNGVVDNVVLTFQP
jgi:hypothetical protein